MRNARMFGFIFATTTSRSLLRRTLVPVIRPTINIMGGEQETCGEQRAQRAHKQRSSKPSLHTHSSHQVHLLFRFRLLLLCAVPGKPPRLQQQLLLPPPSSTACPAIFRMPTAAATTPQNSKKEDETHTTQHATPTS